MSVSFTPKERTLRAQVAAHKRWSQEDPREGTAAARAASPGSLGYWLKQVDPEGILPQAESHRRAESARKSYFLSLALKSARARKKGGDG